jgi:2-polyprenyl-3-methyl-5-hydroxy-6-metoxy-1,4-benzoquinol methylase
LPLLWNLYAAYYDLIVELWPYQDMLAEVETALDLRPGMRVLDVGCGTGVLATRLVEGHPDLEITAVDASAAMLKRARQRRAWPAGVHFLDGDVNEILSSSGQYDRIVSVNVLWALPDPRATLQALAGHVAPAGRMVHTTPRWRFRFDVIARRHLLRSRGWRALGRAVALLPVLGLAGLLNLAIVLRILRRTWRDRSRWQADGLLRICAEAGLTGAHLETTYAGQGFIITCDKTGDQLATAHEERVWTSKS